MWLHVQYNTEIISVFYFACKYKMYSFSRVDPVFLIGADVNKLSFQSLTPFPQNTMVFASLHFSLLIPVIPPQSN